MPARRSPASNNLTGFRITRRAIARGLRQIEWPARLQRLTHGPLVEMLPEDWELWLDGGHNPGAGAVLAATVAAWQDRPLYLVVGMLNTKNAAGFLAPLAPIRALSTPSRSPANKTRSLPRRLPPPPVRSPSPPRSLPSAAEAVHDIACHRAAARVLICGSLHFAGTILADNG